MPSISEQEYVKKLEEDLVGMRKIPMLIQTHASMVRGGKADRIKRAAMHEASEIAREAIVAVLRDYPEVLSRRG